MSCSGFREQIKLEFASAADLKFLPWLPHGPYRNFQIKSGTRTQGCRCPLLPKFVSARCGEVSPTSQAGRQPAQPRTLSPTPEPLNEVKLSPDHQQRREGQAHA